MNKVLYKDTFNEIHPDKEFQERIKNRCFKRKRKQLRGFAVATVAIILLCSATSVIAMGKQFSFLKLFSGENESGYAVQVKINPINHNDFDGEITEIHDIILNQQRNYKPYMDWNPLEYTKYFDTIGECIKYLGIETSYFSIDKDVPAKLNVICDESGNIIHVLIMTDYNKGGNNVQLWYYIFSDLTKNPYEEIMNGIASKEMIKEGLVTCNDSIVFESTTSEKLEYKITAETLNNGKQVPVIFSGKNNNGVESAESYFSQDEIVYCLHVASAEGNDKSAEETLKEILQLFDKTVE